MIVSFGDKRTEKIWQGQWVSGLPHTIQETARRKLRMLNSSTNLSDLRIPPANRLEKLSGDLNGFHNIRINDQWRIIFQWSDGQISGVQIIDYH